MKSGIARNLKKLFFSNELEVPYKQKDLKRVLVIEDDPALSTLLINTLEDTSYKVLVDWTASGEEAEYFLEKESEKFGLCPYDLIVADIFLEGQTTGLDIWKLCQYQYPMTKVLVTSSLSIRQFVSCLKNEKHCPQYLPKPFTLKECREAVQSYL